MRFGRMRAAITRVIGQCRRLTAAGRHCGAFIGTRCCETTAVLPCADIQAAGAGAARCIACRLRSANVLVGSDAAALWTVRIRPQVESLPAQTQMHSAQQVQTIICTPQRLCCRVMSRTRVAQVQQRCIAQPAASAQQADNL